ncbi:MAG TPA: DUF4199 domain-containing protein [Opitutaceae bacterium]|nr:DUF4199 domain-containing protein [Opitutaceae bacterium]
MKTCSLYGFISALAGSLLALVLYFLGYHSDPAKLQAASWIGGLGGLAIASVCTALGVKARRAEVPEAAGFGYGQALGAGVLISVVSSALSAVFTYAYYGFINPGFSDIVVQDKMDKLQAKGISGAQLEQAEKFTRMMLNPVPAAIFALIGGFIVGFIIALIVAAFLKRPAPAGPPPI